AKPECSNRSEVLGTRNLAGRVPLNRQTGVLRLHPFPVVLDAEQLLPAQLDRDGDARRVRIERVLDQLLNNRCGTLDDLAGGDLVGEMKGQSVDARHERNAT